MRVAGDAGPVGRGSGRCAGLTDALAADNLLALGHPRISRLHGATAASESIVPIQPPAARLAARVNVPRQQPFRDQP